MSKLDEARQRWGIVFSDFRDACECTNSAWYAVEDKQALINEVVQRMQSFSDQALKVKDNWENRRNG